MALTIKIIDIHARQILDSRGNPTVEAEVTAQTETTGRKSVGRESVPSGASTGQFEAIELRDGVEAYFGLGVEKVVSHINERIRQELMGMNVWIRLQSTENSWNWMERTIREISEQMRCWRFHLPAPDVRLRLWICRCIVILVVQMQRDGRCR